MKPTTTLTDEDWSVISSSSDFDDERSTTSSTDDDIDRTAGFTSNFQLPTLSYSAVTRTEGEDDEDMTPGASMIRDGAETEHEAVGELTYNTAESPRICELTPSPRAFTPITSETTSDSTSKEIKIDSTITKDPSTKDPSTNNPSYKESTITPSTKEIVNSPSEITSTSSSDFTNDETQSCRKLSGKSSSELSNRYTSSRTQKPYTNLKQLSYAIFTITLFALIFYYNEPTPQRTFYQKLVGEAPQRTFYQKVSDKFSSPKQSKAGELLMTTLTPIRRDLNVALTVAIREANSVIEYSSNLTLQFMNFLLHMAEATANKIGLSTDATISWIRNDPEIQKIQRVVEKNMNAVVDAGTEAVATTGKIAFVITYMSAVGAKKAFDKGVDALSGLVAK